MIRKVLRYTLIGTGAALIMAAPASRLQALQGMGGEVGIYKGGTPQQAGITLQSWGSGEAREAEDYVYSGNRSIRIITHGLHQGVRLILQQPVDLKTAAQDPAAYFQMFMVLPDKISGNRLGGYEGGYPGMMGGMRGGRGGMLGGPGGEGGRYGTTGTPKMVKPKPLSAVRLVLVMDDNKRIETNLDIDSARIVREEWSSLAIPVAALNGLKETSGQVKEIRIFGDTPTVLYLGEVRVVRDETPIRVDPLEERTIAKNDSLTFTASAEAGPTPLKYEWKIQGVPKPDEKTEVTSNYVVVAEGRTFRHQFRKNGDYTVTLTVSDKNGLKKPATATTNVRVTL